MLDINVELFACLVVLVAGFLQMRVIAHCFDQRQQGLDGCTNVTDNAQIELGAPSQVVTADIDLGDLRRRRHERMIWIRCCCIARLDYAGLGTTVSERTPCAP